MMGIKQCARTQARSRRNNQSLVALARAVCESLEDRRLLADVGAGLVGNYFSDGNFKNLALARTDGQINFDWGTGSPGGTVPAEGFSARWTGQITAPASGTYTLTAESAGGIKVIVGGTTVIDDSSFHSQRTTSGSFTFAQGQFYDIQIEYKDQGAAMAKLRWTGGGYSDDVVPQQQLYRLGTNWLSDWSSGTIGGSGGGFFGGSGDDYTIGTGTTGPLPPPNSPPPTSPPPTSPPPTSPPPTSPPPTSPPPTSPPPTSPPPTSPPTSGLNFNFQPAAAPTVSGYLVDAGDTYGSRNGRTYGWTTTHTDRVVDRGINSDQRLDTNVAVKKGARWELSVPNGSYTVTVGVGDASTSSTSNVWVEGANLYNYVTQSANSFSNRSVTVNVSDGKLTLGIGSAPDGTVKMNYVQVSGAGISPPTSPPPTSPPPTSPPPTSPPTTSVPLVAGLNVNFQPSAAPTVSGFVVDAGATYGARNGQTYGWTTSHADTVVDRNINSDQVLDTSLAVKKGTRWELAVPNGSYTVKVGIGDAGSASSNNVWIEGVNLYNYQSLAANNFNSKSVTVNVSDGKLTVGIGSANSGLTKLNFIQVTGAGISPPPTDAPSSPPTVPPPPATGGFNINFQPAAAPTVSGYAIDAGETFGNRNGQTYGWTVDHVDSAFDRDLNGDQLLDTHVSVKKLARWELAVPNGSYTVKVGVGDAGAATTNNVWIEGVNLFNYQSLAANTFNSKSVTVDVTDGRLTLGTGSAATGLTKLNFIQIDGAGIAASSVGTLSVTSASPLTLGTPFYGEPAGPTFGALATPSNARLIAATGDTVSTASAAGTNGAQFAYKLVRGDAEIIARLTSLSAGSAADITFRSSLGAGASFVSLSVSDGQAMLTWRATDGGSIQSSSVKTAGNGAWLKIKRDGNFFAGYISTTGTADSWQLVGTAGLKVDVFAHAGLAIAGPSAENQAVFSDVNIRIRPQLGGNLQKIADYSYDRPFVDLVKLNSGFKKLDGSAAPINSAGWPTISDFQVYVAGNGNIPAGRYTIVFTGPAGATVSSLGGGVSVSFGSYDAATRTHTWFATASSGASAIGLRFQNTSSGVQDLRVLQPGYSPINTPTYTNEYLNRMRSLDVASIRFMDWMEINKNIDTSWSQRGTPTSANWIHHGVSWEAAIELCNLLGTNLYVNVPGRADDNYVRELATLIKNTLRPDLAIYLEIGNEQWATNFAGAPYNAEQALKEVQDAVRAGTQSDLNYDNLPVNLSQTDKYAGHAITWAFRRTARRGLQLGQIFKQVWTQAGLTDPINTRVRVVLAGQISQGASYQTMVKYVKAVHGEPSKYFYAMGGALYFQMYPYNDQFVNGQWTAPSTTLTKQEVLDAMAASAGRYSSQKRFENSWNLVRNDGLGLMMYEGGHDTFGPLNIQAKKAASLDPQMRTIMRGFLQAFFQQGGSSFHYFTIGSKTYDDQYGTWSLSNNPNNWDTPKAQAFKDVRGGNLPDAVPTAGVFG